MNPRIVSDPSICGGEPCVRGTRIPVHIVLSHLAAGEDYGTVLKHFTRVVLRLDDEGQRSYLFFVFRLFRLGQFENRLSQNGCQRQLHVLQGYGDIPLRKQ